MRKLIVFNNVTLDGYFTDANNDMSWAHSSANDPEWTRFTEENASGGGVLMFGRVTYDLMVSFWPTQQAYDMMPKVAEQMNNLPKIVFSRKMDKASWKNTTVIQDNIADTISKMKNESGNDMVLMGSGSIVSQFTQERLIDEY